MNRPDPRLRIGDVERERAVTALGEHFAAGRLTRDEFDERSEAAWAARTEAELAPLFTDLPSLYAASGSGTTRSTPPRTHRPSPGASRPGAHPRFRIGLLPLLMVGIALTIVLPGGPWPVFVILAVWWFVRPRWRSAQASGRDRAWRGSWE